MSKPNADEIVRALKEWNECHLSDMCVDMDGKCWQLCNDGDCIVVQAIDLIESLQAQLAEEKIASQSLRNAANGYKDRLAELQSKRQSQRLMHEDTGLTPEVCANYKTFEDEAISKGVTFKRIVELMEADRDGRCVVLSIPMRPLVKSDDPMDSDVYCPACDKSLSGGWADYHTDQEWKMCQCFYCGQSIDDTKAITYAEAEAALQKEAQHE